MSWIKTIDYNEADSNLKRVYDRVKGPNDNVDNVLQIHSLRPHTLNGHMSLYKAVLHNSNNTLPKSYLETIGVYVSFLNQCKYCVEHHFAGLKKLLNDDEKSERIKLTIEEGLLKDYFDAKNYEGLNYAKILTLDLKSVSEKDIEALRYVGYTDGEILEINQVTSYFNYVNRSVLGLGVNTNGDILGLSPNNSDDPKNWNHQ